MPFPGARTPTVTIQAFAICSIDSFFGGGAKNISTPEKIFKPATTIKGKP
jgi:hypothetical protein